MSPSSPPHEIEKPDANDTEKHAGQEMGKSPDARLIEGFQASEDAGKTVTWDGPTDPKNPLNWPSSKKVATVLLVSAIGFQVYGEALRL